MSSDSLPSLVSSSEADVENIEALARSSESDVENSENSQEHQPQLQEEPERAVTEQ